MEEIVNKVKDSGLIQLDLATFKPKQTIASIDLKNQLWQELVIKEKDFRSWVKSNDWEQYADKAVHVFCSTDAIIPVWAYMLVISKLELVNATSLVGDKEELEKQLIKANIDALPLEKYNEGRIIVKGCSDIPSPAYAMSELLKRLQPVAKSIMFGEPCSTVPIYKKPKK